MADGRVEFEITADGRKAYASIDQITEELRKNGQKWESSAKASTDNIGSAFSGMLKSVAAAFSAAKIGQMLVNFGKEAIDAASDLAEVQNVVDVTFGETGAQKIESWAKKAGEQFGLTETQAKKFTSTLGAMMKSAGMSGDQITEMSTDLAGLAADMASFYNLDFDTAFQKIRSGISGETEPLKQLGVNMSEANLQAFALQKGLTKTFSEMSQGEKTILRYQYLMQATADAQGDFERTSDGFANASRRVETALTSIKTSIGTLFMPMVESATTALADFLEKLTSTGNRTVMDEFADIDLKTKEKLDQIEATAENARTLTSVLEGIGTQIDTNKTEAGKMLDNVPDGKTGKISDLVKTIEGIGSTAGTNKDAIGQMTDSIRTGESSKIGDLLSSIEGISGKAITAQAKLGEIEDKMPDAKKGKAESLRKKIQAIEDQAKDALTAAQKIDTKDGSAGNLPALEGRFTTLSSLVSSAKSDAEHLLDGVPKGDQGSLQELIKNIGELESSVNTTKANIGQLDIKATADVQDAKDSLSGLKDSAEEAKGAIEDTADPASDAAEKNSLWLETCKELVKTIPGLSEIINTETGEIKGGTAAIREYIDAWEKGQKGLALRSAHEQKRGALEAKFAELPELELDKTVAEYRLRKAREELDALLEKYGFTETAETMGGFTSEIAEAHGMTPADEKELSKQIEKYDELTEASKQATDAYNTQKEAYDEAVAAYEAEGEAIENTYGQAINSLNDWNEEQKTAGAEAVKAFNDAAKAVADYYEQVRTATKGQVDSNISGFDKMKTAKEQYEEAANAAKEYREELEKERKAGKNKLTDYEIEIKVNDKNAQVTLQGMTAALQSQLDYIEEYQENLKRARELGVDDKILAQLSDGSNDSAMKLHAITEAYKNWSGSGVPDDIKKLNDLWKDVDKGKESFTDTLTQQKLAVDENYDAMVKKAEEAAKALDVSGTASESTANNITAMADAIKAHVPEVEEQVNAVLKQLNRLSEWGVDVSLGAFGLGLHINGKHETGLNYVPFDGYLASLHEGEGILTAEENRIWQAFKNGQKGVDYDRLGGLMKDNINAGGNVYLDGRAVGQVISQVQGNQYRSLTRSGWQQ